MTIGFPVVISTQVTIPEQRVGVDKYKRKFVLSRVHPEDRDLVQQQIEGHHVTSTASILSIAYNCPTATSSNVRVSARPSRD